MTDEENNQMDLEHEEFEGRNIHQRIAAVMNEISYIQKGDKKVNNQYTFVGHDAVTAALHPLFVKHGINCLTSVTGHSQDGNRTEATIALVFVNIDNPEDSFPVQGFGYGIDAQDKGPGKAVSYAVKMLLLKTFMLETGERDNEADLIDHITPVNQAHVEAAYNAFKEIMDDDMSEPDFERVQAGWNRLTMDEQMAVHNMFGSDKPEGSKKGYRALLKELLHMTEDIPQ